MPKEYAGRPVYAVSELVHLLATELEAAFPDVWVEGEIGGFKRATSGHCYLTLKDDKGSLKAVMWRTSAMRLGFEPENGLVVLARGKLSVYEASGEMQFYASFMEPSGLGAMQMAFEQAKARIVKDGLADPAKKRPVPAFPGRVGIVTSLEGAALRDVLSVLKRRGAAFDVVVAPALVQGPSAPQSLIAAMARLAGIAGIEVILVTRGGGSAQDLMAFNDEGLARAVAASPIPVISAIGHEVDTVLTDFTADLRAPTPSVAAELLTGRTQSAREGATQAARHLAHLVQSRMFSIRERAARCAPARVGPVLARRTATAQESADRAGEALAKAMSGRLGGLDHRLAVCRRTFSPETLVRWIVGLCLRRDTSDARLRAATRGLLDTSRGRLRALARILDSLSPLAVLSRGYAVAFDGAGHPITRASQAPLGTVLSLALAEGGLDCSVVSQIPSRLPDSLCQRAADAGAGIVDGSVGKSLEWEIEEESRGRE